MLIEIPTNFADSDISQLPLFSFKERVLLSLKIVNIEKKIRNM